MEEKKEEQKGNVSGLSEEEVEKITKAIQARGAKLPCPRCGNKDFTTVPVYFSHIIQIDLKEIKLAGPSIPTVITVCNRCGFLSEHAVGVLKLFTKEEDKNE